MAARSAFFSPRARFMEETICAACASIAPEMSKIATQFPLAKKEGERLAGPNVSAILTRSLKMPKATHERFTAARATRKPARTSSYSTIPDPTQKTALQCQTRQPS